MNFITKRSAHSRAFHCWLISCMGDRMAFLNEYRKLGASHYLCMDSIVRLLHVEIML